MPRRNDQIVYQTKTVVRYCQCGRRLRLLSWARRPTADYDPSPRPFRHIIPVYARTWAATLYDVNAWVGGDRRPQHDILADDGSLIQEGACIDD